MTLVEESLSTSILLILQLAMSSEMTRVSWRGLMSVESSLLMKVSTKLEASFGGVGERLVSGFTATRVCRLATKLVMPLTLEPSVITLTVLSGMGYVG